MNKVIVSTVALFIACLLTHAQLPGSKNNIMEQRNTVEWSKDVSENFIIIDNSPVRYLTSGEGEPLVLIHTMRTQSDYFQKIIPRLSHHYRVYAIDLPGHGGSEMPANISCTEQYFRLIVRKFIDKLNLKNIMLVGESFGATIALTLAATDENSSIEKVVAFNPYDYGKKGGIRRSSKTANFVYTAIQLPVLGFIISHSETDAILKKIIYGGLQHKDSLPNKLFKTISLSRRKKGFPNAFKSIARNWESWLTARQLYPYIKVPVELVYGENDWSTLEERKANQMLIQKCRYHQLKSAGHFSCIDNPSAVLEIILTGH